MDIDDRGRAAAKGLQRAVAAHTDTEVALASLPEPGRARPVRPQRLVLTAALVVLCTAVLGAAVWRAGSGGGPGESALETERDMNRLRELLPASPIDGKASLRLPVLAFPQKGLRDGQTIVVAGRGFEPGEQVGAVFCGSEADTRKDGVDACQLGGGFSLVAGYGTASSEGIVRLEVQVQRFITSPRTGRLDCASAAERCIVALGATADYDRSGGSYLLFEDSPPFPDPGVEVTPTDGLAPGQVVGVSGSGLIPGRGYAVQQCAGEVCVIRSIVTPRLDGTATGLLRVYPEITVDGRTVKCGGRCTVGIGGNGVEGASSAPFPDPVPITFDPDAPVVTEPSTTTTTTSTTTTTAPPPTTVTTLPGPFGTTTTLPGGPGSTAPTSAPTTAPTTGAAAPPASDPAPPTTGP